MSPPWSSRRDGIIRELREEVDHKMPGDPKMPGDGSQLRGGPILPVVMILIGVAIAVSTAINVNEGAYSRTLTIILLIVSLVTFCFGVVTLVLYFVQRR